MAIGSAGCKFSTWFILALKGEFTAAVGLRMEKQRRDLLQSAASLDAPLTAEEDSGTLGDLLPDPSAEAAMLEVDERDRLDRLRAAVEAAIATLPPDQQAAIRGKYWRGGARGRAGPREGAADAEAPQQIPGVVGILVSAGK